MDLEVKGAITAEHEPFARTLGESYLKAMEELATPYPSVKLKQWDKFNQITGGFRPYEFSILCGGTGVGKTTLLANMSAQLLLAKERHFIASVETGDTDFVKRTMSVFANADLNTGDPVSIPHLEAFHSKFKDIYTEERAFLSRYEDRVPIEKLLKDVRYFVEKKKCKVAFIDNLNFFMEIVAEKHGTVEMDRVIHECIIFCKQVPVHTIMVMHPKKTDSGRVESEFDIKGSSTAVQEAHNIFLFNRPHPDLIAKGLAQPHDRELKIAKMRRRGKFVGRRLVLQNLYGTGTSYGEGEIL